MVYSNILGRLASEMYNLLGFDTFGKSFKYDQTLGQD